MKPLLAHIYEPHRVTYPCYVQPKLNGIRALYQNGAFQSRDEVPFPKGLLDHLAKPLLRIFDPSVILDGELYVHGWPLQRINAAVTPVRQHPTEDTLKVEYHVFDVVDFGKSYEERTAIRNKLYVYGKPVCCVQGRRVYDSEQADEMYAAYVAEGYEGMMYRLGDCPYTVPKQPNTEQRVISHLRSKFLSDKSNRCWHLLKRKDWQDDEFRCIEIIRGEGKYSDTLGAIVCETKSGKRFHVGSGFTDADRDFHWRELTILGRPIKVKYLCLSSDGIPLNPTILAIL